MKKIIDFTKELECLFCEFKKRKGLIQSLIRCPDGEIRRIEEKYFDLVRCYSDEIYSCVDYEMIPIYDRLKWDSTYMGINSRESTTKKEKERLIKLINECHENSFINYIYVNTRYTPEEVFKYYEPISPKIIDMAIKNYEEIEGKKWKGRI